MRVALSLAMALMLSACASLRSAERAPPEVLRALAQAGLPESSLGVVAHPLQPPSPWRPALRLQPDVPMQPASTMKLVTAVVALDQLGPNRRGRSELLADGVQQGDVLSGPLYLRGVADPDLDWGALWLMLRSLREQGVREISGGLTIDRSRYQPARLDIGVPPFDEAPEFQYNVIPDALYLNGELLSFVLSADDARLSARVFPAWPGLRVDASAVTLTQAACRDWEDGWLLPEVADEGGQQVVKLRGTFPARCSVAPELNLFDRQRVAAQAVRQIWRELGGVLAGPDGEAAAPAGARVLASHQGRPLAELLRGTLKRSDNPATRMIFLELGVARPGAAPGDTRAAAAAAVQDWFAAQGLAADGLVMDNGSGLSRSERITPAQMAGLLEVAQRGRNAPELMSGLPLAGVDGTMSRRLRGTPAEGRARLKTGTLRNAVGLAGYVPDSQGRLWVVAALLNDEKASAKGRPVLDALIDWIARQ